MRTAGQFRGDAFGRPVLIHSTPTNRFNTDISTLDTIRILRCLARRYAADPCVRSRVVAACAGLPNYASQRDVASSIFEWVRRSIRFVDEEELLYHDLGVPLEELDKELLIVPPVLACQMPTPMGDCDDFSLLLASMLLSAGIQPYYVTVAADEAEPHRFSHIYNACYLADEGAYMTLDAGNRLAHVMPGWEAPEPWRKAIWSI